MPFDLKNYYINLDLATYETYLCLSSSVAHLILHITYKESTERKF